MMYKTRLVFFVFVLSYGISLSQKKDTTLVRLEMEVKKATTDSSRVASLLEIGTYQLRRDFNSVESYANEILKILSKPDLLYDTRFQKAETFQQLGILNRKKSNYAKALQYYLDAQKIFLEIGDIANLPANYHNIGTVYKFQKEYEKSILNLNRAIKINRKLNRFRQEGNNYTMLASVYSTIKKLDSAFYYYDLANEKYEEVGYEEGIYQVIANKGNTFIGQKKYKEALSLQLTNLSYVKKIGKKTSIATSHYNLSRIYIGLGKYEKAIFHAEAAMEISKKEGIGRRLALSYKKRSQAYYNMGRFEKALDDYRVYFKLNDSIFNIKKAKELRGIELSYEFAQQKFKDSIQFAEKNKRISVELENQELKKKWYLTLFIGSLLITGFIVYYGIRYFRRLWENHRFKEAELATKIDKLNTEVFTKKEEITELMTETLIHLRSKEKLTEDLDKLSKQEEGASLKSIIAELKADKLEDSKLIVLKKNIEILNYEFLKRIREAHPKLTKTDIEICSFTRLGLSRKEIANLRNTSIDAIKSTRFRLKKKLQLSAEESLNEYIKSL